MGTADIVKAQPAVAPDSVLILSINPQAGQSNFRSETAESAQKGG